MAFADDGVPTRPPAADRDMFGLGSKELPKPETCTDWRSYACADSTDPLDETSPQSLRTWLSREYLMRLPVSYARHDSVAHYAIGASRDEAGPAFGGGNGLENRWTIDGAPADHLRSGGADTRVPLVFLDGIVVQAGGFSARDRASFGGTIDAQLRRGTPTHEVEAYVWGGLTGEPRQRPIASGAYSLRRLTVESGPDASVSLVGTGPLPAVAGGKAWYAAGVAPSLLRADFEWRASRLVDENDDDIPDGLPGQLVLDPIGTTSESTIDYFVPVMARVGWERGVHAVELSAIGHASRDSFFFANATLPAAGIDRRQWTGDAIATWRGRWKTTRARVQLAWHRSVRREDAHDRSTMSLPQLQTAYLPSVLPDDPDLRTACEDPDPDDNFAPCVIPFGFFLSGGPGQLVDTFGDRPTATADIAHRRGPHVVRAGLALEDTRLIQAHRFSGGEIQRSLIEDPLHLDRQRFYVGDCPELEVGDDFVPCNYVSRYELRYRTRYTAAFVEDTFQMSDRVKLDAGLRWELMWVGTKLHFSNQLSPRFGITADPRGGGRSRLFLTSSRTFVHLPAGLGPTILDRPAIARDVHFLADTRTVDPGSPIRVADGIQAASQNEITLGGELALEKTLRVGAWAQFRWLERGIETTQLGFDNPGRDGGARAQRESEVYAVEVSSSPKGKFAFRASWLWGRTWGNWTGAFDPRQGQSLYASPDFDNSLETRANITGILPSSPGHRAFVEGIRRGRLGSVDFEASTRLTVASGRPRNVLGETDIGLIHVLPRGSDGRMPMQSSVNARLVARLRGTDLIVDVFNVFDRRIATAIDELYVFSTVRPITNGSREDLLWLKSESGQPPILRTAYQLPTQFQSPFAMTVGVRRSF